jgi:hypothetical protein
MLETNKLQTIAVRANFNVSKISKLIIIFSIIIGIPLLLMTLMLKNIWLIGIIVFIFVEAIILGIGYIFIRMGKQADSLPKNAIAIDGETLIIIHDNNEKQSLPINKITKIKGKNINFLIGSIDCGTLSIYTDTDIIKLKYVAHVLNVLFYLRKLVKKNK